MTILLGLFRQHIQKSQFIFQTMAILALNTKISYDYLGKHLVIQVSILH